MRLIFIYGLPATGKLTVGRELAVLTGYRLFHNHLTVDLLLSVFEFGSPAFIRLREQIWLSVIDEAGRAALPGMIFTFNPESTVSRGFVAEVEKAVARHSGVVDFVELVAPLAELRDRIENPSRSDYRKLSSRPLFEQLLADGSFDTSHMPEPAVTIDTGTSGPVESARFIAASLGLR